MRVSFRSGCAGLVLSLAFALVAIPARAERARVALVLAAEADEVVGEVASRMQAELAAAGFEVRVSPVAANVDMRRAVELTTTDPGVVATFAIISDGQEASV